MSEVFNKTYLPENTSLNDSIENMYKKELLNNLNKKNQEKILKNKTITLDLKIQKNKNNFELLFCWQEWFPNIKIKNIDALIYFCKLHWFFPKLNKIYIDEIEISKKIIELDTLLKFWIVNWEFNFWLFWEISKITKSLNKFLNKDKEKKDYSEPELNFLISQFERLFIQTPKDIINIFWKNLERMRIDWALLENIFAEIALRIEDKIREYLNIYSTYLINSQIKDDKENKTDLTWTIKKESKDNYSKIPIQLSISSKQDIDKSWNYKWHKIKNIEEFLIKENNKNNLHIPFVVLLINWEFEKEAKNWKIINKYNKWLENKDQTREKQTGEKFPFFIDNINQKYLNWAETMYFVLHIIYKSLNLEGINNQEQLEEISQNIQEEMKKLKNTEIKLSKNKCNLEKIKIDIDYSNTISKKEYETTSEKLTKRIFEIKYNEKKLWTIIIYINRTWKISQNN